MTVRAAVVIRVGLIGAGKMGVSHYAIANAHPDVAMVAVCDTTGYVLSLLKKQAGVETFKDHREMMDEARLDAVIVASPTSTHFACAKHALDRNLHLFVERPLTLTPAESKALSEMAIQKRRVNQVGFHNRFAGTFQEARRLVRSGVLGTIASVRGTAHGSTVTREHGSGWRTKKSEGGGCLHDYGSQVIDLMNFLVGAPTRVAGARLQHVYSRDVEDAAYAIFGYASGATGVLEINWSDASAPELTTCLQVMGSKGKLTVDRRELAVFLADAASFEEYRSGWNVRHMTSLAKPVRYQLRGEEYSAQLDAFFEAAKTGDMAHENSFASAYETDRMIELIVQAAQADKAAQAKS